MLIFSFFTNGASFVNIYILFQYVRICRSPKAFKHCERVVVMQRGSFTATATDGQILCLLMFVVGNQLTLHCKISDNKDKSKGTVHLCSRQLKRWSSCHWRVSQPQPLPLSSLLVICLTKVNASWRCSLSFPSPSQFPLLLQFFPSSSSPSFQRTKLPCA